jgi:hypothetical protein
VSKAPAVSDSLNMVDRLMVYEGRQDARFTYTRDHFVIVEKLHRTTRAVWRPLYARTLRIRVMTVSVTAEDF